MIEQIVNTQSFSDDIWGDLQEVLSICSQLFTTKNDDSISLEEVYQFPNNLPQEAFDVLANDFDPLLFRIGIDGYGGGIIGVLDAENNPIFGDIENEPKPAFSETESEEDLDVQVEDDVNGLQNSTTEPVQTPLFFEDDEEDYQSINSSTKSSTPIVKIGFGVIIGAIIGGLVVTSLTTPNSVPAVVEVPESKTITKAATPNEVAKSPVKKIQK